MSKFENVKPGDTVYCIGEEEDCSGFLFMAVCNGYVIVCPEYSGLENDFAGQLQEMCDESMDENGVDVYIFPEDRVCPCPEYKKQLNNTLDSVNMGSHWKDDLLNRFTKVV